MIHDFALGAALVPLEALVDFDQSYEAIGGESVLRMMNGAAGKQSHWRKTRTVLSGTGWCPIGLDEIDWSAQLTLKCAKPRAIGSASNVITLPAARRSDFAPVGFAVLGDLRQVETSVAMGGDIATLTAVAGAIRYRALYVPQLEVFASPPSESASLSRAEYRWEIVCEEV